MTKALIKKCVRLEVNTHRLKLNKILFFFTVSLRPYPGVFVTGIRLEFDKPKNSSLVVWVKYFSYSSIGRGTGLLKSHLEASQTTSVSAPEKIAC